MRRNGNITLVGELRGLKPARLIEDPALTDLRQGLIWFNKTENKIKFYDGTAINTFAVGDNLDDYLALAGGVMTGPLALADDAVEDMEPVTLQQQVEELGKKQNNITGAASTLLTDDLTSSRIMVTNDLGKAAVSDIDSSKLLHLANVDSDLKEQIDSKQPNIAYRTVSSEGDTMEGDLSFSGTHTATNLRKPVEPTDAVRLIDIDNLKADLDFQADALFVQVDGSLVDQEWETPLAETRIIVTNIATLDASFGTIEGLVENDIIVKTATGYEVAYSVAEHGAGVLVWARDLGKFMKYDGTVWNEHGGLSGVTASSGLGKEGNTIFVKYGAGTKESAAGKVAIDPTLEGCIQTVDAEGLESVAEDAKLTLLHNPQFKVEGRKLALAADSITEVELKSSALGNGLQGGSGTAASVKAKNPSILVDAEGIELGDVSADYLKFDVGGTLTQPIKVLAPTEDANPATKKFVDTNVSEIVSQMAANTLRFEQSQYILDALTGTAETAYSVVHNFGNIGVIVSVYGEDMRQLLPDAVELVSLNQVNVVLANPQKVLIVVQGLKAVTLPVEP